MRFKPTRYFQLSTVTAAKSLRVCRDRRDVFNPLGNTPDIGMEETIFRVNHPVSLCAMSL